MALTKNESDRIFRGEARVGELVVSASADVFQGALLCVDTDTEALEPATDGAGISFAGVAYDPGSGDSAGNPTFRFLKDGTEVRLKVSGAMEYGDTVYVSNDQHVTGASGSNSIKVGRALEADDELTGFRWVKLGE